MLAWLSIIWKNRLLIGVLAALLGSCIALGWAYYKGSEHNAKQAETKALHKAVDTRQKQNEIRNNRPDDKQLIDSLLNGEF